MEMDVSLISKLFLYCPDTAPKDAVDTFEAWGYLCRKLTKKESDFWAAVKSVGEGGQLVIYSHGDANGPLMVRGEYGDDMAGEKALKFGAMLKQRNIKLYLLSCHTGSGTFFDQMESTGCMLVAPTGYALVKASSVGISVYSIIDSKLIHEKDLATSKKYAEWKATINGAAPNRLGKALLIPK